MSRNPVRSIRGFQELWLQDQAPCRGVRGTSWARGASGVHDVWTGGQDPPTLAVTCDDDWDRVSCLTLETVPVGREVLFGTFNVKVLAQLQALAATGSCLGSSPPLSR